MHSMLIHVLEGSDIPAQMFRGSGETRGTWNGIFPHCPRALEWENKWKTDGGQVYVIHGAQGLLNFCEQCG